ncbi:MAG TPA: translation initiation factor IF-2 [Acholeplasma sp.]|nr:translation initiation factor IF-2 [Acholeplasma sp.]
MAKKTTKKVSQNKNRNKKQDNQAGEKIVIFKENMTVPNLAEQMGVSNAVVIKALMQLGVMASINLALDRETIELVALELGYEVQDEVVTDVLRYDEFVIEDEEKDLKLRPAVVTVMGHVDHGKTTLLDTIRKSRVTAGEHGGITQHIGAYQVDRNGKKITFIDTPGHAAFTEMRKRGAGVTDIVILVVAADDGVMPQTLEALDHAKAANAKIIVAVNKIDRPTANPDQVMSELSNYGLLPEEWGGDTPYIKISALKNEGIDKLLDLIDLIAEIEEYKANPNREARGTVIEAKLDKGRGVVATLIVQSGTLKVGDNVVVGTTYGKVRTMEDDLKNRFKEATPSQPVEITGLNEIPKAGDIFMAFEDERTTRQIAEKRLTLEKEGEDQAMRASLENVFKNLGDETKELNLLIKADTQGSIEALRNVLMTIDVEGLNIHIVRASVGAISENDIILASASNAIVIGFSVRPTGNVREIAKQEGVEIRLYNVIYRVAEEIEQALKGMLEPTFEEVVIGQVEVRDIFKSSKVGTIAGGYVTDGIVKRDSLVRLIREGVVIYEGRLASLKRFKDDVREVRQGYECGLSIVNYNDIKVNDVIEVSELKEVEV